MDVFTVRGLFKITLLATVIHLMLKVWSQRQDGIAAVRPPCLRPQPAGLDLTGGPYAHGAVAADALKCSAIGSFLYRPNDTIRDHSAESRVGGYRPVAVWSPRGVPVRRPGSMAQPSR
ncbi:Gamma-glutamyltranspeptidase 1 [Branchiostoma belcheri]|nr:Gamma-glutamyltranspeptidase 1 [Branchiostoma belcheri]